MKNKPAVVLYDPPQWLIRMVNPKTRVEGIKMLRNQCGLDLRGAMKVYYEISASDPYLEE